MGNKGKKRKNKCKSRISKLRVLYANLNGIKDKVSSLESGSVMPRFTAALSIGIHFWFGNQPKNLGN